MLLMDTGANTVLIRRSFVRDQDLTEKKSPVTFADNTIKKLPVIEISTPDYSGWVVHNA